MFGSVKDVFNLAKYLKKNNVALIISSGLEHYIGNLSTIHIAAALELKDFHGVNALHFFNYRKKMPYKKNDIYINLKGFHGLGVRWDD